MLAHFQERQRTHPAVSGLLVLAAVLETIVALMLPVATAVHVVQWIIVTILIAAAFLLRELRIRVGVGTLNFGFGPIRRTVRLSSISDVKIIDTNAGSRAGVGIRRTHDGYVTWIAQAGSAVEVRLETTDAGEPRGYILSTARPHDLAAALQSGRTSRAIEEM